MSCLKGKSSVKKNKAKYICEKCEACTHRKEGLCRPEKLKPKKNKKKGHKKDKDKK